MRLRAAGAECPSRDLLMDPALPRALMLPGLGRREVPAAELRC